MIDSSTGCGHHHLDHVLIACYPAVTSSLHCLFPLLRRYVSLANFENEAPHGVVARTLNVNRDNFAHDILTTLAIHILLLLQKLQGGRHFVSFYLRGLRETFEELLEELRPVSHIRLVGTVSLAAATSRGTGIAFSLRLSNKIKIFRNNESNGFTAWLSIFRFCDLSSSLLSI